MLTLRIILPDANPSPVGQGTLLRPEAARRQELQLRLSDLDDAVAAIPAGAWHYGRVIAVAESPSARPRTAPRSAATSKPSSGSSTISALSWKSGRRGNGAERLTLQSRNALPFQREHFIIFHPLQSRPARP